MARASIFVVTTTLFFAAATTANAAEYYVDPSAGSEGDGSEGRPWASLQDAIDGGEVSDGDTVWLMSGNYGELRIESADNADTVTIAAASGHEPLFTSVLVRNSTNWTFRGLHVIAENAGYLIDLDGDNEEVRVEESVLMSTANASSWSAQDWINRASSGISVDGTRMTIRNNLLRNVGYGISVSANNSLVEGNLIENFSRDGLRGLGDYSVFQYNTVKNCYAVDDHHDDGFQSWSVGDGGVGTGEVVGMVLRGNTFINYEDPNQPHRGTLQGIGCFDGTFVDWVVENNVVVTDHWHGITLLGARNSSITNNTVIDLNQDRPGPPWISIDNHKNGTAPTGCVVRNNLTTALSNSEQVLEESNITFAMDESATFFVDPLSFDLHLREGAPAVDTGTATSAPDLDRDLIPRPQGEGVDVGAYEWHDGSAKPAAPGPPSVGPGSPGDGGEQPSTVDGNARGCAVQGQSQPGAGLFLLVLAALVRRRR